MDLSEDMENADNLIINKDLMLPSNLNEPCLLQERVHSIKMLIKFLSSYELSELDETLMQFVMPALKKSVLEVFETSASILQTVSEDNISYKLKENLQIAVTLFHICDEILNYLNTLGTVQYYYIQSIPAIVGDILLSSFQHCKYSQELYPLYKEENTEIIQLFRKTQEVHIKFMKWFEDYVVLDEHKEESVDLLCSVLNTIVFIGNVLLDTNQKSMADNWKSYTAITQKYSDLLNKQEFDLSLPLRTLNENIKTKLEDIIELDMTDIKQTHQIMKIVNFLIKVTLKLFESFLSLVRNTCKDVLDFCFILYSYSPNYFLSCQYPMDLLYLMNSVCENRKLFVTQLFEECSLLMVALIEEVGSIVFGNKIGTIELLVDILSIIIGFSYRNSDICDNLDWDRLIDSIFQIIHLSSIDLYLNGKLYEDLVVNVSVISLIASTKSFPSIEKVLLRNIVQDHFWAAILAMDVWYLILKNSSLAHCIESITYLLKQMTKVNTAFTSRVEVVYLNIFLWRIYQLVPSSRSLDMITNFQPVEHLNFWQVVEFQNVTASQRCLIEPIFVNVYQLHDRITNIAPQEFLRLMESLDALSTLPPNSFGMHATKVCQIIADLWNFTLPRPTSSTNNFVKYFMRKLFTITKLFLQHFSGSGLLLVLNQLKQVSVCPEYKILIVQHLNILSSKTIDNCLETNTILAEIAGLLELLLCDSNPVVKQLALQECYSFINNSPYDQITNSVIRNLRNTKHDVNPFLQRTPLVPPNFQHKYFQTLEEYKFEHKCILWSETVTTPIMEKPVLPLLNMKQNVEIKVKHRKAELAASTHQNKKIKADIEPSVHDYCEIDSLISSIKTEMKSLVKAAKKENLTKKNVSDINYIIAQLRSVAQK